MLGMIPPKHGVQKEKRHESQSTRVKPCRWYDMEQKAQIVWFVVVLMGSTRAFENGFDLPCVSLVCVCVCVAAFTSCPSRGSKRLCRQKEA